MNKLLLKAEGLLVLILTVGYYSLHDYNWWLLAILFFVPDLAMVGYLLNNKIGSLLYNCFHTYAVTLLFVFAGVLMNHEFILSVGLIWTAHIGMDRVMGYGLKYSTAFKDTHLQRV